MYFAYLNVDCLSHDFLKAQSESLSFGIQFYQLAFILKIFIYLFDRERETAREGTQAGRVGEGEAGFLQSREPDAGLHPRTLGSRPEPKADA